MTSRNAPPPELLAALQRHLASGDLVAAEAAARALVDAAPAVGESHNALGVVLRRTGQLDAAADAYRRALAVDPGNARARNNLGDVLKTENRHEEAIVEIEAAVTLAPDLAEAWRNLAQCAHALGRHDRATDAVRQALRAAPDDPRPHCLLGRIEHDRGNPAAAETAYRTYLAAAPDDVEALTDLGLLLAGVGRHDAALKLFRTALDRDPAYVAAEFGLRESLAALVPPWHLPMMNERKRNEAYRDAIRAVVRPSDHVLDIGTGAGLLALLAAEAGARAVTTCEMVEVVAQEAQEIVSRSAFANRIRVVAKPSTDLQTDTDMDGRADVLVSEILANDFIGEGVLPSLIDAHRRLLKPGARTVPARGAMMGVLVGGPQIEYLLGLGDVCGFDMASFARLRPWRQPIPQCIDYDALSDDIALLDYDFGDLTEMASLDRIVPVTARRAGLCYGILQWISLELAPGITYDNHPHSTESVWNKMLYAFPQPVPLAPGDTLGVRLWQKDDHLYVTSHELSEKARQP